MFSYKMLELYSITCNTFQLPFFKTPVIFSIEINYPKIHTEPQMTPSVKQTLETKTKLEASHFLTPNYTTKLQ